MSRARKQPESKINQKMSDALLNLNDLQYVAHTDASAGIHRQLKSRYPDKSLYKQGQKMVFRLGGDDFADFSQSSLYFTFRHTEAGGAGASFGANSAICLFNRARVLSPTGDAISDVQNLNAFEAINHRLKTSAEYSAIVGAAYGLDAGVLAKDTDFKYTIPLRMLSPLFQSNTLMPPQFTQGMTIEFYLEAPSTAYNAAADSTYTLANPELALDSTTVADGIASVISKMDLVYQFTDVVQSESFLASADKQIYYEIPHSLTTAVEAVAVLRDTAKVGVADENSFLFVGPRIGAYSVEDQLQWSLGSLKFPQQKALDGARIYNILLNSQGVLDGNTAFDINRNTEFQDSYGCYPVDLRRSKIFADSGREVSNNQRLSVFIRHYQNPLDPVQLNYVVDTFVWHVARIVLKKGVMSVER